MITTSIKSALNFDLSEKRKNSRCEAIVPMAKRLLIADVNPLVFRGYYKLNDQLSISSKNPFFPVSAFSNVSQEQLKLFYLRDKIQVPFTVFARHFGLRLKKSNQVLISDFQVC